MPCVAFPLRIKDSFLKRTEEPEAVLALIEVMARTPHGSWAGSAHFGLRDYFEDVRGKSETQQVALQELNGALQDLGITAFRAKSIQLEASSSRGGAAYVVTLVSTEQSDQTYSLRVNRQG